MRAPAVAGCRQNLDRKRACRGYEIPSVRLKKWHAAYCYRYIQPATSITLSLKMQTSTLFKQNYNATAHVVVNQGGTSSGKTYTIMQALFVLACSGQVIITVVGQDIPNLKVGALRDARDIWNKSAPLQQMIKGFNRSDRVFEFHNGSIRSPKQG